MSKTDKTRPFHVKMVDSPSNFKAVHNHAWRHLRDKDGKDVFEPSGKVFEKTGKPIMRRVVVPFTECDLPEDPLKDTGSWPGCHWNYTASWIASGEAHCGCKMCTGQEYRKAERRRERHAGKKTAKNWEKEY